MKARAWWLIGLLAPTNVDVGFSCRHRRAGPANAGPAVDRDGSGKTASVGGWRFLVAVLFMLDVGHAGLDRLGAPADPRTDDQG